MSSGSIAGLVGVALLLVVAAYLSAAETVLGRLALVRALRLEEEEAKGSEALVWAIEHRTRALNVVLLLTVVSRVMTASLATLLAIAWLPGGLGATLAIVVVIVLSMVLAEIAPRTATLRRLERTGLRIAPLLTAMTKTLDPVARVFIRAGQALVRASSGSPGPFPTDDELRELLVTDEDAEDEGMEESERAMIHSIFELGDTVVREIMVPRPDMITVAEDSSLREVVNTIIEGGYSRIPVHRDSRDEIIGVVYAKDVMRRLALQPGRGIWRDLVREPTFVPETKQIDDLLRLLQETAVHLALVVDEYGAMTGLVTIEDILEEIVGEIVDEHDREEPLVELLDDVQIRVDARLPVDDLNELLDSTLPDDAWDTVGGLVFGMLGRVPSQGESVEIDGLTLVAERVQGRRVSKVLVTRRSEDPETVSGVEG